MSAEGNGRNAVTTWLGANLSTIIIIGCGVVAAWAVNMDRASRNEVLMGERFTALSVRLTKNEDNWQDDHDLNRQQTADLNAFQARLAADQQTRDVRTKARDDQIDAIQRDVRALQESDRATGQWQAAINERLVGMVGQLERISRLLEQRLPDPPVDQRPPVRR